MAQCLWIHCSWGLRGMSIPGRTRISCDYCRKSWGCLLWPRFSVLWRECLNPCSTCSVFAIIHMARIQRQDQNGVDLWSLSEEMTNVTLPQTFQSHNPTGFYLPSGWVGIPLPDQESGGIARKNRLEQASIFGGNAGLDFGCGFRSHPQRCIFFF